MPEEPLDDPTLAIDLENLLTNKAIAGNHQMGIPVVGSHRFAGKEELQTEDILLSNELAPPTRRELFGSFLSNKSHSFSAGHHSIASANQVTRIESASDMHDLTTLLETERHLLYVAATRHPRSRAFAHLRPFSGLGIPR